MISLRSFVGFRRERGAVLFVALAFLVLLTLLALSSANTSIMQERMAGSTRNAQLADFGGETALREAEATLWAGANSSSPFVVCGKQALFSCYEYRPQSLNGTVESFRNATSMVTTGGIEFKAKDLTTLSGADASARLSRNPYYLIEDLGIERPPGVGAAHESGATGSGAGPVSVDKHIYRITARSTGGSDAAVRSFFSTFAAKAN